VVAAAVIPLVAAVVGVVEATWVAAAAAVTANAENGAGNEIMECGGY